MKRWTLAQLDALVEYDAKLRSEAIAPFAAKAGGRR